jgi:hypothetical protein
MRLNCFTREYPNNITRESSGSTDESRDLITPGHESTINH